MMQKFLALVAIAATLVIASVVVPSSADAHHRIYRHFGAYTFSPWYAPRYRYAAPYHYYRYYDRFGSNLNPDRQMVGIGE
jgi:hypothetical protein